jgi:hypothetical protein
VDLAARAGQPVYAAGGGLVSYAARLSGRGVIAILHGPTLRTTYLPVRPSVRTGRRVAAGDRIGVVENLRGHCGPQLCLHLGLLRGPVYLDPLSLLHPARLRLLPVWGVPPARRGPQSAERVPPDVPYDPETVDHQPDEPTEATGPGLPRLFGATAPTADPRRGRRPGDPALSLAGSFSGIREASGGVVVGMLLAFTLMLAWRRLPTRRRPPRGVIDLARERRRRRCARADLRS